MLFCVRQCFHDIISIRIAIITIPKITIANAEIMSIVNSCLAYAFDSSKSFFDNFTPDHFCCFFMLTSLNVVTCRTGYWLGRSCKFAFPIQTGSQLLSECSMRECGDDLAGFPFQSSYKCHSCALHLWHCWHGYKKMSKLIIDCFTMPCVSECKCGVLKMNDIVFGHCVFDKVSSCNDCLIKERLITFAIFTLSLILIVMCCRCSLMSADLEDRSQIILLMGHPSIPMPFC